MGSVKITEKPVAPSVKNADTIVIVIDGKLYRAELETVADLLSEAQVAAIQEAGKQALENVTVKIDTAKNEVTAMVERADQSVTAIVNKAQSDLEAAVSAAKKELDERVSTAERAAKTAQDAAKTAAEDATADAKSALEGYVQSAESAEAEAKAAAKTAADDAAQGVHAAMVTLVSDAQEAAASAENSSQSAQTAAEQASADADRAEKMADSLDADKVQAQLNEKADNLYFDEATNLLYLTCGGEIIGDGIRVATSGGGGGGGGDVYYTVSVTNLLESRVFSISSEKRAVLAFNYSSKNAEDDVDDGPGSGSVSVGGVKVRSFSAAQGENQIDVTEYLTAGTNSVKVSVENSEGTVRSLVYTVTVVTLRMSTTLEELGVYTGAVTFYYTPTGEGSKTIHFVMDDREIGTATVTSTGRGQTFTIPAQSHGAHIFTAYAEVTNGSEVTRSNVIRLGMVFAEAGNPAPIVLLDLQQEQAKEGDNVTAKYLAYDPNNETADITLLMTQDGTEYSSQTLTVARTAQNWVVNNLPGGEIVMKITCGSVAASKSLSVERATLVIEPATDSLELHFSPAGRSNAEGNPATWTDGSVTASFSGVGFSGGTDGWLTDETGAPLLRLLPGASMSIPYQLFASDRRTGGATVEVEMATHNVRDYESVVLSCLSGGRGVKIASQYAEIRSEQSELSMQFKEDQKVRLSFVIEPQALHRLMYVFVDGVMCGAVQYPADDNFAQSPAVGITIGAESSGIDVYRIRIYTRGLDRGEVLDNYVADLPTLAERTEAYRRNDLLDLAGNIQLTKLPSTLPYMVISCPELPQYKGDKKTCSITYVDPAEQERSFTAENVQIDVQGTSSAGYKKKNFKWKLKSGLTMTASGEHRDSYQLRGSDSVPASVFCMKADVASSEGANNVELVRLYNDTCPYQLPAQEVDSRVRVGIDGKPCVIFWQNSDTGKATFWGKYNFNNDKSAAEVFGLTDGCESWEIRNNTSERVVFKSADFEGTAWLDDFEARHPDGSTDCTKLKTMCEWVVSTDRSAVASESDKQARLKKFKDEFEQHFVKEPMLFYYVFTEVFLMVDNRAKNFFPTTYDGVHWLPLPYDFDTALGINNEGQLVFDYDLEDTDKVAGSNVFNGQDSVLWCNLRDAFPDEIKAMYTQLRSGSLFGYVQTIQRFAEHQAVWPERVWNEDAWEKYLEPLENDNNAAYLPMLQGDKASQRDWWAYNGFRYRDSKYQCGDASAKFITLRCYAVGDITVTPYSHIWPRIKYGSYTVTKRGKRNQAVTLACPLASMSDTEVYIYSADRLAAIGDLKDLQVGYADFTAATKLQSLKLGDGASGYSNPNLTGVDVGNNELLTALDVRNCPNLASTIDLSGCVSLETVLASGSGIKSVTLPVGGKVKTLELPNTITNLTVREQKQIERFTCAGYGNLTTLRVENSPGIPLSTILSGAEKISRVRLIGAEWHEESEATLSAAITKLKSCAGMDASGNNTENAVVTGRVHVPSVSAELLAEINEAFPQLVVVANNVPQYIVRYLDWSNTVLYRAVVAEGANAVDAVVAGYISAPTRAGTEDTGYKFKDFGALPTDIHGNVTVVAQYVTTYRVRFMNGAAVYNTQWVVAGGSATTPSGTPTKSSTAQYSYTFSRWSGSYTNVTAPVDVTAVFTSTVRKYTVSFYCGSTLLQTVANVPYGGSASYTGDTPVDPEGNDAEFEGWIPSPSNITGTTSCYAQFVTGAPTATDATNAYGVEWDFSQDSTTLTRCGLAAVFANPAPSTTLNGSGSSPFDGIMPWAGMKKYNIIDGAVSYSEDDDGFSETDYDTVVYIPEFYYTAHKDVDNSKWLWAISPVEMDGYEKHPGSGRYIGRFHSSGDSTAVFSKSGVNPLSSVSITNFNAYSHDKGEKWYQMDAAVWSALQMLYLVEFADLDSQNTLGTGQNTGAVKATGATTGAVYHTLKRSAASNQYRWVENPFSNLCTWLDGFFSANKSVYLTTENTSLSVTKSEKKDSGIDLPSNNGCISGFGYSPKFAWAFIPDTATGTDYTKYAADHVYSNSSYPITRVGGYYGSYANYGFFYMSVGYHASEANSNIGSRLLYIP